MVDFEIKERYNLNDYRRLMEVLRGPGGCPWDAVQTHESIRRNLIEEAYETAHAIDKKDSENLCEELGDLLMQVLFHARMEEEAGRFSLDDVADTACKKLVFRHPHVFGDVQANTPDEVLTTWEEVKRKEKNQKSDAEAMNDVPENLPSLWRAEKIIKRGKLEPKNTAAEMHSLLDCVINDNLSAEESEAAFGKLVFDMVCYCRKKHIDPEAAVHTACSSAIAEAVLTD